MADSKFRQITPFFPKLPPPAHPHPTTPSMRSYLLHHGAPQRTTMLTMCHHIASTTPPGARFTARTHVSPLTSGHRIGQNTPTTRHHWHPTNPRSQHTHVHHCTTHGPCQTTPIAAEPHGARTPLPPATTPPLGSATVPRNTHPLAAHPYVWRNSRTNDASTITAYHGHNAAHASRLRAPIAAQIATHDGTTASLPVQTHRPQRSHPMATTHSDLRLHHR